MTMRRMNPGWWASAVRLARGLRHGLPLALTGALAISLAGCGGDPMPGTAAEQTVTRLTEALGGTDTEGYRRADHPRVFRFPDDHGPHPGFRNEWWYITGNLDAENGDRFGFHITFFRVALAPQFSGDGAFRSSDWTTRHIWMGHSAVTDVAARRHVSEERFAREGAGLAGATDPADVVWLENWSLSGLGSDVWQLVVGSEPYALELELTPLREPVLQGDAGLSQKGREPGNASFYYSVPRIAAEGTIRDGQTTRRVAGQAWLDREWSTSALDAEQVGWDWFALQLDDGTDIMYYQLRLRDGSPDPLSKGRWMPRDAPDRLLRPEDVELVPRSFTTLPSGRRYPVAWTLSVPEFGRKLSIEAVLERQEMNSFIPYWEGAVDVRDAEGRKIGRGFVEMTGYDEP